MNWMTGHVSVGVLAAFFELLRWSLVIGLVILTVLLLRQLVQRLRRRSVEVGDWQAAPLAAEGAARRSLADCQSEFRRCVGRGDLRGALEALWWAMACGLAPPGLDESWTTDEVLAAVPAARSAPRRTLLLQLDRLLYRGDPLGGASLRSLADRVFDTETVVTPNQPFGDG